MSVDLSSLKRRKWGETLRQDQLVDWSAGRVPGSFLVCRLCDLGCVSKRELCLRELPLTVLFTIAI